MNPTQRGGFGLAIIGTAVHTGLVLALLVLYASYVPAAKRTFDEFGMTLPWLTLSVIRLSNWIAAYWWALIPVFGLTGIVEFVLLMRLGRRGWILPTIGIALVALWLGVGIVVTLFSIALPMAKLREGLAN
jgi:hypothetical protein